MKNIIKSIGVAIATAAVLATTFSTQAASSANQTVSFEVSAISDIAVSGDPGTLTVTSLATPATDSATTYDVTSNEASKKITAVLDSDMPSGTTLTVALAAPSGASSAGAQALSTTPADVVTGISGVAETGLGISYSFSATLAAVAGSSSRTVTLTITD